MAALQMPQVRPHGAEDSACNMHCKGAPLLEQPRPIAGLWCTQGAHKHQQAFPLCTSSPWNAARRPGEDCRGRAQELLWKRRRM